MRVLRVTGETAEKARALLKRYDDLRVTPEGGEIDVAEALYDNFVSMAELLRDAFGKRPKPQPLALKPTRLDSARGKMWMAMRIQRQFTAQSIAAAAGCSDNAPRKLIKALIEARYARCDHTSSFNVGDHSRFTLLRDTGPLVPRIQAHGRSIYDPNLEQEVPRVRA